MNLLEDKALLSGLGVMGFNMLTILIFQWHWPIILAIGSISFTHRFIQRIVHVYYGATSINHNTEIEEPPTEILTTTTDQEEQANAA